MARGKTVSDVNRRKFLTSVAVAGASGAVGVAGALPQAQAAETEASSQAKKPRGAARPTAAQTAADLGPTTKDKPAVAIANSDYMVDALREVGIEYVFANTASSFLGLQESVVNYANNKNPEFITCNHEESSVGMAHGYAKASGKLAAMFCHGTVGMQHAAMAMYNAWCDRAPLIAFLGNNFDALSRTGSTDWRHSAQDPVSFIRDFTKWDDQPISLQSFGESVVRAATLAMTPPQAPVAIAADSDLQEAELKDRTSLRIPKFILPTPPAGEAGAVREAGRWLVGAEHPVIVVDIMSRTPAGMKSLIELAELLNAPVIDQIGRQNFPNTHYLWQASNGAKLLRQADVVLCLELTDLWGTVNQYIPSEVAGKPKLKPGTKVISINANDLNIKPNYQYFQRYQPADLAMAADAEATMPALIDAVKSALTADRRTAIATRADAFRKAHADAFEEARQAATLGWDASPISTSRMCMELWPLIKDEDWSIVSVGAAPFFMGNWAHRLWRVDAHHRYLGNSGGGGVGYGLPAAVGAALHNKSVGRFSINLQCDGDFMYAPGALWTAAHHHVPLLTVMHNNRAYGQETMNIQRIANRRNRGADRSRIGTAIDDPPINYAKLAESFGVHGEGPITNPKDLVPAYKRAIATVKRGEPALIDVVTQLR